MTLFNKQVIRTVYQSLFKNHTHMHTHVPLAERRMKQMSVGCTVGVGKMGFTSDDVYFLGEMGGEII